MNIVLTTEFLGNETEADLVDWLVSEGQSVVKGQALCQIETSKTTNEFSSPADGRISLRVDEGDLVELDTIIAVIE
ncbi:lipoyl domain-containing protein [Arthrobacter roseus]|uniref:lipoyl domain-containing protein n=1 Tax=Arthrobacter roseus TaxID=136274 RepID=UPI0019628C2B|nr:lipoyl domain-containing protein [Arthrobacter roseus]MBM7847837.1 pyruvate/2-oxoglutarate dehydrogenase complex dihydrolipoamide acyltransferase (E2) component [Arthrobacter roseus]